MSGGANCAATSASLGSVLLTSMLMESISYDASNGSLWLVKDTPIPCLKDDHVLIKVQYGSFISRTHLQYIISREGSSSWSEQVGFTTSCG